MENKYLTVTALTKYIKQKFDRDKHLRNVLLKGEVSNLKYHPRGHLYFTLKDEEATIDAAMFHYRDKKLKFKVENGLSVLVQGHVSTYIPFSKYQFYAIEMEPDGLGSLHLAFEQLKKELTQKGYFDKEHKKEIPLFPRRIAIITSKSGAAVRDIITTIDRRFPIVYYEVIPVQVQGEGSAAMIEQAIRRVNERGDFDTIILARGGGSIEDLWSFNERNVVEAIFSSNIPIICGVGHETDTTLSDYAADLRAPTPTAAAELAVPSLSELKRTIAHLRTQTIKLTEFTLMKKEEKVEQFKTSYAFYRPSRIVYEYEQRVDHVTERLAHAIQSLEQNYMNIVKAMKTRLTIHHPKRRVNEAFTATQQLQTSLNERMINQMTKKVHRFQTAVEKLTLLNPLEIMRRGFVIPYGENDEIIKSVRTINLSDEINLKFVDGNVHCEVKTIQEDK